MDFSESTKIVYNRIKKVDPENVTKIFGYLLLQDHSERDFIRLAFCPDNLIHTLVNRAKTELGSLEYANSVSSDQFSNNSSYNHELPVMRISTRPPSLPELPVKVCHYFNKGFCKHENNCRYFHNTMPERYSENQRHGKTGFSLTKLLARLKNSIRVIYRSHDEQHSVILVDDLHRCEDYGSEKKWSWWNCCCF